MKTRILIVAILLGLAGSAVAHFQVLVPSTDIVSVGDDMTVRFDLRFTHPMDGGPVMHMGPPSAFGVVLGGRRYDLLDGLRPREIDGRTAYTATYRIREPGDHVFYVEPAPYYEPAERKMIVHYTKVVVGALGTGRGWDEPVGLPVEIEPLVRPYGLWTGNAFRGIVRKAGEPVPFAEIEVEYLNDDGDVTVPSDPFVTQVIKADPDGVFSYVMPHAGWWGFAALIDADEPMPRPDGEPVDVELGALMWVKTVDMDRAGEG